MRVLLTKSFGRFARRERIGEDRLCDAVERAERGLIDADLGGDVIKQRIGRKGQGRSGGFRVLIVYRPSVRAVFLYGFAKNERDNIDDDELVRLRRAAAEMLGWSNQHIDELVAVGEWTEIEVARTKAKSSYKSRIAEAIHETMRGAQKVGVIDKRTMREFDVLCLRTVEELSPGEIRALRERERASQAVFASYLNVTTNLVSKWERGQKRPSGAALKLLSIVKAKGLEALA